MKQVQINKVLDAVVVSSSVNSTAVRVEAYGPLTVAVQVSVTAATTPTGTIQLEGSLNGTNFFNIGSTTAITAISENILVDSAPAYAYYRVAYVRSAGSYTVSTRFFVYGETA